MRFLLFMFLSASMLPLCAQNDFDARIIEYTGLRFACGTEGTPVLKIRNVGTEAMATCVVETWKNGIMVNSFDWVLAVPALEGETRQPTLPVLPLLAAGDALEFRIISVNGQPDEGPDGNILAVDIDSAPPSSMSYLVNVALSFSTDPDSLVWSITDDAAQVVASGGPFIVSGSDELWVELQAASCYMVRLAELGGEPTGDAQLAIFSGGQQIVDMVTGTAEEPSRSPLVTGIEIGYAERAVMPLLIAPNPANGSVGVRLPGPDRAVEARLRDAQGRSVMQWNDRAAEGRIEFSTAMLTPGIYSLEVLLDGARYCGRLVVE